jgi:hypothetical protein
MSIQTDLEQLIHHRPQNAEDAERIAEAASLLAEYHRLLARVRGLLNETGQRRAASGSLAGLALHEAAERALAEAGVPLHAKELGKRMKARGWRHPRAKHAPPDRIEHQLAARLPQYPQFRKVAPQTFGLASWGDSYPGASPLAAPPTALFAGSGGAVGARAGTADDPFTTEDAAWRSS